MDVKFVGNKLVNRPADVSLSVLKPTERISPDLVKKVESSDSDPADKEVYIIDKRLTVAHDILYKDKRPVVYGLDRESLQVIDKGLRNRILPNFPGLIKLTKKNLDVWTDFFRNKDQDPASSPPSDNGLPTEDDVTSGSLFDSYI